MNLPVRHLQNALSNPEVDLSYWTDLDWNWKVMNWKVMNTTDDSLMTWKLLEVDSVISLFFQHLMSNYTLIRLWESKRIKNLNFVAWRVTSWKKKLLTKHIVYLTFLANKLSYHLKTPIWCNMDQTEAFLILYIGVLGQSHKVDHAGSKHEHHWPIRWTELPSTPSKPRAQRGSELRTGRASAHVSHFFT